MISKLIQQMVCDLSLLPYEFVVLGNSFQKVLDSKGIKTPHNCAGLKVFNLPNNSYAVRYKCYVYYLETFISIDFPT